MAPDASLSQAVERMVDGDLNQVLVVQDGRVVGLLSQADVMRFLGVRQEFEARQPGVPEVTQARLGADAAR